MAKCSICSEEELLPFTCNFCKKKFCRIHHLPENHECTDLTKEKLASKKVSDEVSRKPSRPPYKKAYEIPGVREVLKKTGLGYGKKIDREYFDIDEKIIAALILLSVLILGLISRYL